jgi:hypothetical protein
MGLEEVTHLDLGCSPVGLRLEDLIKQGYQSVGIDQDTTLYNKDFETMRSAWRELEETHPDEFARAKMHDGPRVIVGEEVESRLIMGDVIDTLRLFGREQIEAVYGDYFFHELDHWQKQDVREQLDRVLVPNGKILATLREGGEFQGFMGIFDGGYEVVDDSWDYPLITNDQRYWKAIEGINNTTNVQITLLKCETAAR